MNPFKRFKIEMMFFWGVVGFMTLLLAVVSYIITNIVTDELVENTSHYQSELLTELNQKAINQFQGVEQLSLNATKVIEESYVKFQDKDGSLYDKVIAQDELNRALSHLLYTAPKIHSVELWTNVDIIEKNEFVLFEKLINYPDDDWAKPIQQSDSAWLGKHTIKIQNHSSEVISFAKKLYTRTNVYYGILIVNTDVKYWEEVISSKNHYSMRTLLDSGDRLLLHLGQETEDPIMLFDFTLIPEQNEGYMKTIINDKPYLMVWSRSPDSKWSLIEFTTWDKIVGGSNKIKTTIWSIGFVSMFVILFIIRLFVTQFTRPIMHLVRLMNKYPNYKGQGIIPDDYRNEFGHLFEGYRKLVNRIESLYSDLEIQYTMQKEVEVKALQAMINPHFLYNTLDQINWAAIDSNQTDVSEMISLLGRMLRITLSHGRGLITLTEELELVQCYLELQKIRWKDRLSVNINVPESLHNYVIPKVTIQPFIENAFRHGFHGKKRAQLTLYAYEEKGQLCIVIEDDGRGLRKGWQESTKNSFGGYALKNVIERIHTYFGDKYGFELYNLETGGVRAVIYLPIVHQTNPSNWD